MFMSVGDGRTAGIHLVPMLEQLTQVAANCSLQGELAG
jgi:hypothetical protein